VQLCPGLCKSLPQLTELPDGTLVAIWSQKKDWTGGLYSDIHSARVMVGN
jgi:hypothetical protein